MELLDELRDAYVDNTFELRYYLDLETGRVVIDWDDEANEKRYADVPKITSDEAYYVCV